MHKRVIHLAIPVLIFIVTSCAAGTPVALNESNFNLIQGTWTGKFERRGEDGTVYFEKSLTLKITAAKSPRGEFLLVIERNGEIPVEIRNGKAIFSFDGARREFTLMKREKDGILLLRTSYGSTWEGWPRVDTVLLEKKK